MKRGFIRVLWGKHNTAGPRVRRREDVDIDMKNMMANKYEVPSERLTFVFGEDNYHWLCDLGFNCVLLDKSPEVWERDSKINMWMHKLAAFEAATSYFDEFIFLDFDCMPIKPLPDNFWEEHYKKEIIQASLSRYNKGRAVWREKEGSRVRKHVPCACYVYIRDSAVPGELIRLYEDMVEKKMLMTEEDALAKYTDDMYGGWKGFNHYWEHFEPEFYVHHAIYGRKMIFGEDVVDMDKVCFAHFQDARNVLKNAIENDEEWLKEEYKMDNNV